MDESENTYESSVEYRIEREKLNALISATNTSKYEYENDRDGYLNGLNLLDEDSPIMECFVEAVQRKLNSHDYSDDFNTSIKWISNNL